MQTDVTLSGWCLGEAEGKPIKDGGSVLTQMKGHAAGQELIAKHQVSTERAKVDVHRYKLRITTRIRGRIIYFTCIIRCLVDVL